MAKSFDLEVKALGIILGALEALDDDQRSFVLRTAADRVGTHLPSAAAALRGASDEGASIRSAHSASGGNTPKQFMAAKRPTNDVQRIACLAYYLTHERNQPHFKTADLKALNTEAAGVKIGNPAQAVANATLISGYLATAGEGRKQISATGEAVVDALPDQTAAKAVAKAGAKRRTRKSRATSKE
jgi:hypothetical protein